jgi:hypothetical protein
MPTIRVNCAAPRDRTKRDKYSFYKDLTGGLVITTHTQTLNDSGITTYYHKVLSKIGSLKADRNRKILFMDALQSQIDTLDGKVDILHRAIEQLSHRLTEVLDESRQAVSPMVPSQAWSRASSGYRSDTFYPRDAMMEHKDVLMDGDGVESMTQTPERLMSPELQIQRLTAQLTAAYNRIAALEEQLLARRVS